MNMQAVYVTEDKKFHVGEFPLRAPVGDEVLIKTHYSGISVGTEFTAVRGIRYYGEHPYVLGYQGTGVIAGLGPDTTRFKEGDPVYFRSNAMDLFLGDIKVNNRSGTWASHVIHSEKTVVEPLPTGVDGADRIYVRHARCRAKCSRHGGHSHGRPCCRAGSGSDRPGHSSRLFPAGRQAHCH